MGSVTIAENVVQDDLNRIPKIEVAFFKANERSEVEWLSDLVVKEPVV
jgi:hypothetical protein